MAERWTREARGGDLEREPEDWATGNEPMTAAQRSYLKTLSQEAGVPFQGSLTKAEASLRIDELQDQVERRRGESKRR